ncbi:FAD-dependent oxidoreductase [Virgibacillus dokdonensis]|uniref:FAD-dependent oxidoreductase n=1 Tax=Virgibacillus dokdonensis TaxID=302167 RepID=A0A3E0WI76_9BACI|nr:FAD-binding oxidoreductase [Virgibacillus dokdonensis]RFA32672.1 FAD-dependent oxidoreductase [Virgibacillus dokdonensis]
MKKQVDMIIVGGGVIGSSIAYHLLQDGFEGEVTIFEKDNTYAFASTPRSAGGFRQLFTTSVNIQLSRYGLQKYKTFPEDMAVDRGLANIDFKQRGYLFLANKENIESFRKQHQLQRKHGVPAELLTKEELCSIIPELHTDDLRGGLYCSEDGYLDPYSVMQGYVRKAKQLGGRYVYEEVDAILKERGRVGGVKLKNGDIYTAPIVVNCAGPWAAELSEKAGMPLPIVPLKRQIIQFNIADPLKKELPLTIDPSGVYFRHEGSSLITGYSEKVRPGIEFSWQRSFFEQQLWPVLAKRIANFERAKIKRGWAGLYSHNIKDQNAIIGEHPQLNGYYMACGFSGHGMQQAPGVGKGLSELIRTGKYETLDLSPLRFERFASNELIVEGGIV